MPQSDIVETLEMVSKAKTREEKRQILKDRENFATKAILQLNYEVKKLDYYVDPSPHNLPMLRREAMFVQLLERLTPKDAKLLIDMKDKKISYKGLSYKLVRDTWPDLLPEIEEEKSESKSKEAVVEE